MRIIERTFSDLLRKPGEITSDVERGDVLLRRRGEPDLRLTRADREADRAAAFSSLSLAIRNLAAHQPRALASALDDAFPWLDLLPDDERLSFAKEFASTAAASGSLDSFAPLTQLLREWRATAEIYADPALFAALSTPVEGRGGAVARPHD
jgi:hypothetical protein